MRTKIDIDARVVNKETGETKVLDLKTKTDLVWFLLAPPGRTRHGLREALGHEGVDNIPSGVALISYLYNKGFIKPAGTRKRDTGRVCIIWEAVGTVAPSTVLKHGGYRKRRVAEK